jgi:plasmid stabilization system protein ParE
VLPVYFLPAAEAELQEAQDWYDTRVEGLGDRFFAAVDALLPRIGDNPEQFPTAYTNLRRVMVRRFPYALYFRIEAEGVYVIACFHTSRDPRQWRRRT